MPVQYVEFAAQASAGPLLLFSGVKFEAQVLRRMFHDARFATNIDDARIRDAHNPTNGIYGTKMESTESRTTKESQGIAIEYHFNLKTILVTININNINTSVIKAKSVKHKILEVYILFYRVLL